MLTAEPRDRVFCLGLNKTGTTSWTQAMESLGYVVASETKATRYFDDWATDDFHRIIDFCRREGQAFQDIPFSLPGTYRHLDRAFPGSKFVLTVRDSADQWYQSLIRFHSKLYSASGSVPPTAEDLAQAVYYRQGFIKDYCSRVLGTPENDPYNREMVMAFYRRYQEEIVDYFKSRPDDLLILNVADPEAYPRLCIFLGLPVREGRFPWKNRTGGV